MNLRNNLSGKMMYKSFIPGKISDYQSNVDHLRLQGLASAFKELDEMLMPLPEDDIMQLIRMEANDSWRLSDDKPLRLFALSDDNENAYNIVRATVYGSEALEKLPISTRMICNIHYLICEGSDYDKKYRGEYRKSPVWIGGHGCGLLSATFVPPVGDDMTSAITDLENYINYSDDSAFVKAAVIHYQFEMIHPFVDGNGRTGRLVNSLLLQKAGVLKYPALLLSHIISRDYNRYCDAIQYVNETGDIFLWINYWLNTLKESTNYTIQVLKLIAN